MGETTGIAWTESTWNPWHGCTHVSAGCDNCFMFTEKRKYGQDPEKVVRGKTTFNNPLSWKEPRLIFTCSWSDWFHADADAWRDEAWSVIRACPNLDFQILTKRPERISRCLPDDWGTGYHNAWLGVSIENDRHVGRADTLRAVPAAVRFISAEPLLADLPSLQLHDIHWLIVGGESGPGYRPMDTQWARNLRDRAMLTKTAFFFKQSAAPRTEMGIMLDGTIERAYPRVLERPKPVNGDLASLWV